jgi:hypothetical protein
MVHKTNKGPYCRNCGLAAFRHHQNRTLLQGWFGFFSFFITPISLLLNLYAWQQIRSLAAPQRAADVQSKIPAPLNPGKPLIQRPGLYVGAMIVLVVASALAVNEGPTNGGNPNPGSTHTTSAADPEVIAHNNQYQGGLVVGKGTVKNEGDSTARDVQVIVTVFDGPNQIGSNGEDLGDMSPGQQASYSVSVRLFSDPGQVDIRTGLSWGGTSCPPGTHPSPNPTNPLQTDCL